MSFCAVPGCGQKSKDVNPRLFFKIPTNVGDTDADQRRSAQRRFAQRRSAWLKAINATKYPDNIVNNIQICSKHFVTGRPVAVPFHIDWIPSLNLPSDQERDEMKSQTIENIITNLPEVCEDFDAPEYEPVDNEKVIELVLIHKYMLNPVCDANGCYNNDHDYLGLPLLRKRTDPPLTDHNYAFGEGPACHYFDSRHFCNICRCNRKNLFNYNTHMTMHTLQNDVTCSICKKKFFTTTCLNNHLTTHTTWCKVCLEEVPTAHINEHRQANSIQKHDFVTKYWPKYAAEGFICVFCTKTFRTRVKFNEHVAHHRLKRLSEL